MYNGVKHSLQGGTLLFTFTTVANTPVTLDTDQVRFISLATEDDSRYGVYANLHLWGNDCGYYLNKIQYDRLPDCVRNRRRTPAKR